MRRPTTRPRPHRRRVLAWSLAIPGLAVLPGCWEGPPWDEIEVLQAEGEDLRRRIEAFREQHGRLPESLGEAGPVPGPTRYGEWRYYPRNRGRYMLMLGEQLRPSGWELIWSDETGWSVSD